MIQTGAVTITGADLGGLNTALTLLRAGRRVRVYEQAHSLGEAGTGISVSVSAGTSRGLAASGHGPAFLAASLPVPAVAFAATLPAALAAHQTARSPRVEAVRSQTILQGELIPATDPDRSGLGGSPSQDMNLFSHDQTTVAMNV